jgi:hypothetical protein
VFKDTQKIFIKYCLLYYQSLLINKHMRLFRKLGLRGQAIYRPFSATDAKVPQVIKNPFYTLKEILAVDEGRTYDLHKKEGLFEWKSNFENNLALEGAHEHAQQIISNKISQIVCHTARKSPIMCTRRASSCC